MDIFPHITFHICFLFTLHRNSKKSNFNYVIRDMCTRAICAGRWGWIWAIGICGLFVFVCACCSISNNHWAWSKKEMNCLRGKLIPWIVWIRKREFIHFIPHSFIIIMRIAFWWQVLIKFMYRYELPFAWLKYLACIKKASRIEWEKGKEKVSESCCLRIATGKQEIKALSPQNDTIQMWNEYLQSKNSE